MYKKKYYERNKDSCARYIVSTKTVPEFVNNNLYPNIIETANRILVAHKK